MRERPREPRTVSSPSCSSSAPARPRRTCKRLLDSGALGRPLLAQCQTLWFRDADYFAVPWRGKWETEGGGTTLGHGIHQARSAGVPARRLGSRRGAAVATRPRDRRPRTSRPRRSCSTAARSRRSSRARSRRAQTSSIRIDTQKATVTVDHLYGHGHENWSITPAPHVSEDEAAEWALPDDRGAQRSRPAAARRLRRAAGGRAAAADRRRARAIVRARRGDLRVGGRRRRRRHARRPRRAPHAPSAVSRAP